MIQDFLSASFGAGKGMGFASVASAIVCGEMVSGSSVSTVHAVHGISNGLPDFFKDSNLSLSHKSGMTLIPISRDEDKI
jgi:hypothetical protein